MADTAASVLARLKKRQTKWKKLSALPATVLPGRIFATIGEI